MNARDPLEDLLRQSLRSELEDRPVDTAPLTHAARRRAQQIRRRRTTATTVSLALVVAGIAVAATGLHRDPITTAGPSTGTVTVPAPPAKRSPVTTTSGSAAAPSAPAPSTSVARQTEPTATSSSRSESPSTGSESPSSLKRESAPGVSVSSSIAASKRLLDKDFPWSMTFLQDLGEHRNSPTAEFQACPTSPGKDLLKARQFSWYQKGGKAFDQYSATEIITIWGNAGAAFDDVVDDSGACKWSDSLTRATGTDANTYVGFTTTTTDVKLPVAVGVRRSGDMLVAVTVYGPQGTSDRALVDPVKRLVAQAEARATR